MDMAVRVAVEATAKKCVRFSNGLRRWSSGRSLDFQHFLGSA